MSTEQNTHEFSFTTSCDYWEDKTYEEIKKLTYVNPLYDPGFKAFLGDEEALKSFLNAALRLGDERRIDAVSIKNVEINIIFPNTKTFRLDIRATTSDGRSVDIEMQKAKPAHFIERILLQHSAFLLQSKYEQDKDFLDNFPDNPTDKDRKEREDRFYKLPPTIAIWVCDFPVEKQTDYRGAWKLKNERGLPVTDKIEYIILLREQAKNMVMTEEELDYLASLRERAREEGKAEGIAEGEAKGLEKGSTQTIADTEAVLRDMGIAQDKIAEMQVRLEALRQSRLAQK